MNAVMFLLDTAIFTSGLLPSVGSLNTLQLSAY
jgi:hypothetical protein